MVTQASFELIYVLEDDLKLLILLPLLNAEITGVCHHPWFIWS